NLSIRQHHRGPRTVSAARSLETLFPHLVAGLQVETFSDAVLADGEEVAVVNDAGANAALDALETPKALSFCHVTESPWFYSDGTGTSHVAAHRHEGAFAPEGRGVDSSAKALADPKLLTRAGVVSSQAVGKTHDQFVMSDCPDNHRCAPSGTT